MTRLQPYYKVPRSEWVHASDSTTTAIETVRQWLIAEMFASYGYPESWKTDRLHLSLPDGSSSSSQATAGFQLTIDSGEPFLIGVASKKGDHPAAESLLREILLSSNTAGVGIASDGTPEGTVFLRRRFDSSKCEYLADLENYSRKPSAPGAQPLLFADEPILNESKQLVPLTNRIENLFFELHSHLRDIDGLHADVALDELCKLLYAKLFDEEQCPSGSPPRLQRAIYGTTEEFAAAARSVYSNASDYDLRVFRLKIPQYERSRGVFATPLILSSPAITRVLECLQGYSLTKSDADVKGRAFQRVLGPAVRSGMGQYFTPEPVIDFMVRSINPTVKDLILDPFCGSAHFLSRCLAFVRSNIAARQKNLFHEFAFGKLHGIEKSDRMVRVAMTDMRLHGDGHSNVRCTDALLDFANYPDLEPESFDIILTNPPFGSLLTAESIAQLGKFELAAGKKRLPLEILGLERCLQFLRPGGRMGIVLPDSVLSNRNTRYVREWIRSQAKLVAIVSLPIETFSPFGANIKTSVMFLRKWKAGENRDADYEVKLIRVDSVGYDANGRRRDDGETDSVADEILKFTSEHGW